MSLALLWRHKLLIAAATAATTLVAFLVTLTLPNTYRTTSTVLVTPAPLRSDLTPAPPTPETYRQIAATPAVIEGALEKAGLGGPERPPEWSYDLASRRMRVEIHEERGQYNSVLVSPLLDLTVRDSDPERAARIANAWAASFQEVSRRFKGQGSSQLAQVLEERSASAEARMRQEESTYAEFERGRLIDVLQQQAKVQNEVLAVARADRIALEGQVDANRRVLRALEQELGRLAAEAPAGGQAGDNTLASRLAEADQRLAASMAAVRDYRRDEEISSLEADLEADRKRLESTREQVQRLEERRVRSNAESERIAVLLAEASRESPAAPLREDLAAATSGEGTSIVGIERLSVLLEKLQDPALQSLRERFYEARLDATVVEPQLEVFRGQVSELRDRVAAREVQLAERLDRVARLESRRDQDRQVYEDLEKMRLELQADVAERAIEAERLGAQLAAAAAREAEIEATAQRLQTDLVDAQLRHDGLLRDLGLARDLHARLAAKAQEARASEAGDASDVSVVSLAVAPDRPISPQLLLNLLAGALFGAVSSSALVLLLAGRPT